MFGGNSRLNRVLDDTWTWNGTTWTQQAPATRPPARVGVMVKNAATGTVVLFTSAITSTNNETWTWG